MHVRLLPVLLLTAACSGAPGLVEIAPQLNEPETKVLRVIDGDTIETNQGETVRIIGIDTPETKHPNKPVECYGPEASAYAERTLLNRTVRLEGTETDRYGRRLAHLWVQSTSGEYSYGLDALTTGHAVRYRDASHDYAEAFLAAEQQARDNGVGLWKDCDPGTSP